MTVLLQKTLTRTDLGANAVKNLRISLAKAQVRDALSAWGQRSMSSWF